MHVCCLSRVRVHYSSFPHLSLPPSSRPPALDLVLSVVREYDPLMSAEEARSALGALGLRGDMALRKV